MASDGLKIFLDEAGDAVHSVNTTCIGLAGVAEGVTTKPPDMHISWSSKAPETAARRARHFVLSGSLVFVQESLLEYLRSLRSGAGDNAPLCAALDRKKAAERIGAIGSLLPDANAYWAPLVVLLVHWRNRVVHRSNATLGTADRRTLYENRQDIASNHAGIDVCLTLRNFEQRKITLKDFTTLIAVTIRFVRYIDDTFAPGITTVEQFKEELRRKNLSDRFHSILQANGDHVKQRKITNFIRTEFPSIGGDLIEQIFEKRDEVVSNA